MAALKNRGMRVEHLTQQIARELVDYEASTGVVSWRTRDRRWFTSDRQWKVWNKRFAGKPFTAKLNGYLVGVILGKTYLAHRLAWLWMCGTWPDPECDRADRNRTNNKWQNLRVATDQQNARNQSLRKDNTSNLVGVRQRWGRYHAYIHANGRDFYLGTFTTLEAAAVARRAAAAQHGFSPGHGRARLNSGPG